MIITINNTRAIIPVTIIAQVFATRDSAHITKSVNVKYFDDAFQVRSFPSIEEALDFTINPGNITSEVNSETDGFAYSSNFFSNPL